ncbi:MAG: efflux RND transporter permease subunit [Planctomycetota bacterium]
MNFVRLALHNPYAVVVAMLAVAVLGFNALRRLPADLLPIFKSPAVQIVTLYPGMPPVVVEKDISSRLQRWTGQSVGIARQEAKNMLGVSIVRDYFREDIDADTAMSQVTSLAVSDMFYLPPGTLPPMVMPFDPTASVPACLLSVFSETMTEKELYDVAYFEMRNRLQAIQGVIAPAVYGGVLRRILTYVDRDRLEARNLSPLDVADSLRASNPFVPAGSAHLDGTEYFILSNAMVEDVDDLNDVPIRVVDGVPVRIGDIGEARDSHQIQSNIVRINGRRQVYIPVYRQPGANTLAIVDEVRNKARSILQFIKRSGYYDNVDDLGMEVVMDQSTGVRESIATLRNSAILGAALVALVVLLFLRSVRSTLIVLTAIPIAVLGALTGLYFTGDTINAMTLGGLSLAIGILVDQSIVVIENIARHARMGKSAARAALDGAGEVAAPVLVSTVTFVVVFFPVVFLGGLARFLFTPLALAVIFATITSFAVAMTFIPAAAARFPVGAGGNEGGGFEALARRYRGIAERTLRLRWGVLAVAAVLFAGSALALTQLGRELFPKVDAGQLTVLARAQPGTTLEQTEAMVQDVEHEVMALLGRYDPEGKDPESDLRLLISNVGVLYDWPAGYTPNAGPMDAFLLVQLKDERSRTAQECASLLRAELPQRIPGVEFAFDTGGMMTAALNFGQPAPINLQVRGSKLGRLQEIANAVVAEAQQVEGAVDVRIAEPTDHPAISIHVDRTKAAMLGLTQEDVIKNVATVINSSCNFAPAFWIDPNNGNHYLMGAQYDEGSIRSLETLLNIPITGPESTAPTLLKNIASVERTTTPVLVTHQNITRTINVFADVDGRDVGSVAAEIWQRVGASEQLRLDEEAAADDPWALSLQDGDRVLMEGEFKRMQESFADFGEGLLIAAILVYLVMVAQFRSFTLPLAILLTVPLGIIGVVPILWLTGTALSIPAFMGLILMVGIVVQYSVLVVEFAARRQRQGAEWREAILDAARDRLRPVLMTSLTTSAALVPMALGLARGGEANVPLARSIIGAVVGGTLLSLFVVPPLYSLLGRWVRPDAPDALDATDAAPAAPGPQSA